MKLRYRAQALADLGRIHEFVSQSSTRAANDVLARLHNGIGRLKMFPQLGRPGSVPGTRELILARLPYIVVYRIADDTIDIIGVFHAAQER